MTPTPKLAFTSLVATLAFLGLAISGWGGFAAFFSNPARIALTVVVFALTGAALLSSGNLSSGEREDRGNRWVLLAFARLGYRPPISRPTRTAKNSGSSTATPSAGSASFCSPSAARCGSGRSSCSAAGSADWSPSSPGIRSSPAASTASSAIPAIWACWSTRWAGRWRFARGAGAARRVPDPAAGRAHPRRRGVRCARSSATSTTPTAAAPGGSCSRSLLSRRYSAAACAGPACAETR